MKFKHVIWDLDGTLLDTYPATDGALAAALGVLGQTVTAAELIPLTRITLQHAIREQAVRFGLTETEIYAAYQREYVVLGQHFSPAMLGAVQVMTAVRASGGLNLLATHRDREGATWRLEAAGLRLLLDDMLSVSDSYPRKPDPALFLALLAKHKLNPAEVLAIGDRHLDIVAGRLAGCQTALLLTPGATMNTEADVVVESLVELTSM